MKLTIGRKIIGSFLLILLIHSLNGAIGYWAISRSAQANEEEKKSMEEILGLEHIRAEVKDVHNAMLGYLATGDQMFLEPFEHAQTDVPKVLRQQRELRAGFPEELRELDEFEGEINAVFTQVEELVAQRRQGGLAPADIERELEASHMQEQGLTRILDDLKAQEEQLLVRRSDMVQSAESTVFWGLVIGLTSSAVLVLVVGLFLARNIVSPLTELSAASEQVADGNLDVEISAYRRSDELGILSQKFNQMIKRQREMIGKLQETVSNNNAAASEILSSTNQVAASVTETAAAVNQTTSTVEQVRQTSILSSEKSKNVSVMAQETANASKGGRESVEALIQGLNRIQSQMEVIAETVVRLSEQSQAIGGIITTVNDLADQSNLLSVNAAIEAAKAGEQGKGFAVVAQEIRSMAEQSKQASSQVRAILNDIQKAMSAAVMATEEGGKAVDSGVQQSHKAEDTIYLLVSSIEQSAQAALQIEVSAKQQLSGIDQAALAMNSIRDASDSNLESIKQVEDAVQSLYSYSQQLNRLVEQYQA